MRARRWKKARVVSFRRMGGWYSATFATAAPMRQRIVGTRDGTVSGNAARHEPNAARELLGGLDRDVLDFVIAHVNAAALVDGDLGFDLRPVLLDEIGNADG